MSWLSSFLHPERGYKKGQQQLDKYYNQAQGFQQPFMDNASSAYGGLNTAMQNLLNPAALQGEWINSYEESPAATQAKKLATQGGLDAASSMGLMGSSPAIGAIQEGTTNIGLKDRQAYLDDLMQKYMAGIGIGQNIYGTGANAANNMSQNAMNMGQNSAQMGFGQQNAQGDLFAKLLGGTLGFGAGPIGNALGAGFAQKMGWSEPGSYQPWNFTGANKWQ